MLLPACEYLAKRSAPICISRAGSVIVVGQYLDIWTDVNEKKALKGPFYFAIGQLLTSYFRLILGKNWG
jgi:hypothetical protein